MNRDYANLRERVERLERIVNELPAQKTAVASPPTPFPPAAAKPPIESRAPIAQRTVGPNLDLRTWLRFIGIGLLLFGVLFLFKFSESEPTLLRILRVGIGVALGTGLAAIGRILLAKDRAFAQVLTGGGIGIWYISGFAAYQLFALVPAASAFAYMALVTLLAFIISVRQGSLPLTIVATLGGLATPFLLHDPGRGVLGVVSYIALVATGTVAIYVRREWRGLLWVAAGASALAIFATSVQYVSGTSPDSRRWLVQAGIVYLWITFAVVATWSVIRTARSRGTTVEDDDRILLVALIPLAAILTTATLWNMEEEGIGYLCLTAAVIYTAATARFFPDKTLRHLTSAHFVIASGLAATGALLLLNGHAQHLAVASEALVLRVVWRRSGLHVAGMVSHGLYVIVLLLLLRDLTTGSRPTVPLFNATGITMLWSIAALAAAALAMPRDLVRRLYLYTAHALILAWILHQCSKMANGQALVTIIWGVYGAALLVAGLRRTIRPMRTVGLVTLLVVVAKLFMVDLATVRAIWRVLLFIGFGGVFLALSYWFMSLDRSRSSKV